MTTLSESSNGVVRLCPCARAITVEYGTLMLRFGLKGFQRFWEFVMCIDVEYCLLRNSDRPRGKAIMIELASCGVSAHLTPEELEELRSMVDGAMEAVLIDGNRCWLKESMN